MTRLEIQVPDMNDSFSKISLQKTEYLLRFTWNDWAARWNFGVYTVLHEPIVQGIKVIPRFPLTMPYASDARLPYGVFGVYSNLLVIGRNDFNNGKAIFTFIPHDTDEITA